MALFLVVGCWFRSLPMFAILLAGSLFTPSILFTFFNLMIIQEIYTVTCISNKLNDKYLFDANNTLSNFRHNHLD